MSLSTPHHLLISLYERHIHLFQVLRGGYIFRTLFAFFSFRKESICNTFQVFFKVENIIVDPSYAINS